MELSPDMLLKDRYRIERKLGQGGMGAVYLAFDTALDTQVAVKSNRSPAPNSTAQFLREARLLASLRHPHLPRVTDYFVIEDMQYLVMDYITGQDLDTLLNEKGAQPFEQVMAWAEQLGDAISFLHHQHPPVIHRDIKPANVRLSDEGEVILVDFGIAKVVDSTSQATSTGASSYTPGYAPPEQYGGNIRTGTYTDQYSLAALIYHLLTGEKPADSIERAMGTAQLTPMNALQPDIPPHVQAAVEKALSIRPSDRFAHIDDFLGAIKAPSAPKPAASEATVIERSGQGQTVRVSPTAVAGATVAVPSPTTAVPPPTSAPPPPNWTLEPAAQAPAPPRRKISLLVIGLVAVACLGITGIVAAAYFLAPGLFKPTQAVPVAELSSETPRPAIEASATPTISPSATPKPSETSTMEPSATIAPSATVAPTDTPVPSATPLSIGGGGLIAFSSNRGDGMTFQLWTMRVWMNDQGQVIGGDYRQITQGEGNKRQPAWSPDGRQIAYVAPGEKGNNIWVMNADGSGEPALVTNLRGDESEPAWSPDGNWIAFTSDAREDKVLMLYLVHPDGSGLIKLSSFQHESGPTWSPSMQLGFVMNLAGNKVLYIRGQRDPKTGATPTQPYYVTPSFYDKLTLNGNLGQVAEPAWSPDGAWVAYTRLGSHNSGQIWLAHYPVRLPVEKDILRLTDSNSDTSPAWSPDGQWIIFTSKRDGNSEIYIMRTTGMSQNNLTLDPAEDMDPAWLAANQ